MTPAARERLSITVPLLLITGAAWTILVVGPGTMAMPDGSSAATLATNLSTSRGMAVPDLCSAPTLSATSFSNSRHLRLAFSLLASFAASWMLMLTAMMMPVLIAPVRHIRDRSFTKRRARAIVLFLTGYAAIWIAAGVVLLTLAAAAPLIVSRLSVALAIATFVALVWQFSPAKQLCLNRCHARPELSAFGLAADLDAFRFGFMHGSSCVGSCWALMLLPLLVSRGHVAAMAVVAIWIFAERLDGPMPPRWRWRGLGKVVRIAVAQTRLRLQNS